MTAVAVTGASRGIGAAVMSALEAQGARAVGGSRSGPVEVDYSAAKAALVSFSKSLALRYAADGIRVNLVSPGVTATRPREPEEVAAVETQVPMRRLLDPDEVARLVVLVASGAASGMTGADVVVDGGLAANT